MKLKIGIECESIESDSWGVARLTSKLLEELARYPELAERFQFFLFFKSTVPDYPYLKAPIFTKIVTKPSWFPTSFNLHYHVWMLMRAYWHGIDALFFPAYQLPLLWFGKSLVMTTDDIYYEMRNPELPFRYRLSYWIFGNWAVHMATRIMAISEASKKELVRLFKISPERIVVNHLGVDIPIRRYLLSTSNYLLYVGQAFPRRHLRETMLAFELIAPKFPDLRLIAVGSDKYSPPVIERLKSDINKRLGAERVFHMDHVNQERLEELYAGAKALVYVSDKEAFGLPPLEGLAHGTIPIVADAPISREIFGHAAVFVHAPGSTPDDIAKAMSTALTDTALAAQIDNSREAILKKYTWKYHAERFIAICSQLCSKS